MIRHALVPLVLATLLAAGAAGQELIPRPPASERPVLSLLDFRRRLAELDKLLLLENVRRAEELLRELETQPGRERDLLPRRITLAKLKDDHEEAIRLCRRALEITPRSARFLREIAESQLASGDVDGARTSLRQFIAASPDLRSGAIVAVGIWQEHGRPELALALCDSARQELGDPLFLGRQRAQSLLALDRPDEAADELTVSLRGNPINLPLIRSEILGLSLDGDLAARLIRRLVKRADEPGAVAQERLLAVHLELQRGRAEAANELARPLLRDAEGRLALLQTAALLSREAPLLSPADPERTALTGFLLTLLFDLARGNALESGLHRRTLDLLAQTCEDALAGGVLAGEPEESAARFDAMLQLVRRGNPQSPHLYSAQIHLAHFTRDRLRQPAAAAAQLERLLTDLDLPLEGVAVARLTLGECYLAAGDTARGRLVLTRLGHSDRFRAAAGHAHFHLARLDLAEGHWETARDRFATVAMDNPMAPYANDALDLGLAIADELENPVGGPDNLQLYARAVYYDLLDRPDRRIAALEEFVAAAASRRSDHPQHLLEKGRYELARLYGEQGRTENALAQCDRIVMDHPDGRYPAHALALRAEILAVAGRQAEARQTRERLLIQYPDFLFADDIRDSLRSLP